MSREITISPRLDTVQLATLSRQAASLDRLLDKPFSGPQPIARTGLLEQVGSLLWNAAGLAVDELLAAVEQARIDKTPARLVITDGLHDLPWELLYHQHPHLGFLGRHPWCVVVRRFTGDGKKAPMLLPIGKTHQDVDFRVPRVACYPCCPVALADKPPVAPKQSEFFFTPHLAVAFL
ncbi:MAG: hypothetical protein HY268_06330 [Deltaproteobacteria bacterium]|nr:hypothetical protein [Deltaproteobacteria bacterium]